MHNNVPRIPVCAFVHTSLQQILLTIIFATETNSINGIFAFSRRSFNSAHLKWPSPTRASMVSGPYLPFSFRETYKPTPVQGINLYGHPMKKLYAVMNATYGTIGHVLKCEPKSIACYNAQMYSGCAVGPKHLIHQASPSEALKSLQVFTNQLLMKTSFLNHSLQPSTHSSLAVPNQQTNTCQRIQQEDPIIHHAFLQQS